MKQRPIGGGSPKARLRPQTLSVLACKSKQVDGQWVGHCLDLDLVTQGNSAHHVLDMVLDALAMVIEDDLAHGRDTFDGSSWDPAPTKYWEQYCRIVEGGEVAEPGALEDREADFDSFAAVVPIMLMEQVDKPVTPAARPARVVGASMHGSQESACA